MEYSGDRMSKFLKDTIRSRY